MKPVEIIYLVLCVILAFAIPYWQKSKIYQFCFLLVFPFIIGFLLQSFILNGLTKGGMVFNWQDLLQMIYKAIKFYSSY